MSKARRRGTNAKIDVPLVNGQPDDIVILILGVTAAGKSTFINDFLGSDEAEVSGGMTPMSRAICAYPTHLPPGYSNNNGRRLVLVDTPGLDGSNNHADILTRIGKWLVESYNTEKQFAGVVYLHDITDKRIRRAGCTSLEVLQESEKMCGENPRTKIVMATTHWEELLRTDVGLRREEELREGFWNTLLASGSTMMRIETRPQDVHSVVDHIVANAIPASIEPPYLQRAAKPYRKKETWKRAQKEDDNILTNGDPDDIVIVVMGPTGVGKSTFINAIITSFGQGLEPSPIGHTLESCTQKIVHYTMQLPSTHPHCPGRRLVAVDTPGFDVTYRDNSEVLRQIAIWLADLYSKDMTVAGLVYLSDISEKRMYKSTRLNQEVFRKLCGKDFTSIIMATSHWDIVTPEIGASRETELKNTFWTNILGQGAQAMRIQSSPQDVEIIVDAILRNVANNSIPNRILQIQTELVDMERTIPLTKAGTELRHNLRELLDTQKVLLGEATDDEQKRQEVSRKIAFTTAQLEQLSVPLSDRFRMLLRLLKLGLLSQPS